MLKIRAIQIKVRTDNGDYESNFKFDKGLNIIKGNNTSGKSTLFQAILYGLGMEQLLGDTNEKTMQSVLRDRVEYPKNTFHNVIESIVNLEIENKSIITTQRVVKHTQKNAKLVRVFKGALLTNPNDSLESVDTWIHDSGGATNTERGFHYYLEQFLGWDVPEVVFAFNDIRKLYIQTIFPAFIIEQKSGWSEFLATIPYFGIKQAESRAVEFLLNLDVFNTKKTRQLIKEHKGELAQNWSVLYDELSYLARRGGIEIMGINKKPHEIEELNSIYPFTYQDDRKVSLSNFVSSLNIEFEETNKIPIESLKKDLEAVNRKIIQRQNFLNEKMYLWEEITQDLRLSKDQRENYKIQLSKIKEELRKNKDAKKIYQLGGDVKIDVADSKCPTCSQPIQDSLFPHSKEHIPMNIDENISYVKAQEKMIVAYLSSQEQSIRNNERRSSSLYEEINELRADIRSLKRELTADERLPSITEIEKRIKLKSKVEFYNSYIIEVNEKTSEIFDLSEEWKQVLIEEGKLSKELLSLNDREKISLLESKFKKLLTQFEYSSKSKTNISISRESNKQFLFPVVDNETMKYKYDLRYDSSGSDWIRASWSYYCALFKLHKKTNHPKFMMFDEPAQQDVSDSSYSELLKELASYKEGQVLVFSSFHNSEINYKEVTKNVTGFKLIEIKQKLMKPK